MLLLLESALDVVLDDRLDDLEGVETTLACTTPAPVTPPFSMSVTVITGIVRGPRFLRLRNLRRLILVIVDWITAVASWIGNPFISISHETISSPRETLNNNVRKEQLSTRFRKINKFQRLKRFRKNDKKSVKMSQFSD